MAGGTADRSHTLRQSMQNSYSRSLCAWERSHVALVLAVPLRAGDGNDCNQQCRGLDTDPGAHSRLSCACERSHVLALAPHLNSKSSQNSPS